MKKKGNQLYLFLSGRTFFGSFFFIGPVLSRKTASWGAYLKMVTSKKVVRAPCLLSYPRKQHDGPFPKNFSCARLFFGTLPGNISWNLPKLYQWEGGHCDLSSRWGGDVFWRHCLRLQNFFNGVEELVMTLETKFFFSPKHGVFFFRGGNLSIPIF